MNDSTKQRTITLRHKRQDGTWLEGILPSDDVGSALRKLGFKWSDHLAERRSGNGWYAQSSRRRASENRQVDGARTIFEQLGCIVVEDIDDTTPAIGFAELEAERKERYLQDTWDYRYKVRVTLRRIADLEKRLRDIKKALKWRPTQLHNMPDNPFDAQVKALEEAGVPVRLPKTGLDSEWVWVLLGRTEMEKAVYAAEETEIKEEIAYWQTVVDQSGEKVSGPNDWKPGDFVQVRNDRWYEVVDVNAGSLSIPRQLGSHRGAVVRWAPLDWGSRSQPGRGTVKYLDVKGRMSAQEARAKFPEAFDESEERPPYDRPEITKYKGLKIENGDGHNVTHWYFEVNGERWRATWEWPKGWWIRGDAIVHAIEDIPPVTFWKPVQGWLGKDEPAADDLILKGPIVYDVDVRNQLAAHIVSVLRPNAGSTKA